MGGPGGMGGRAHTSSAGMPSNSKESVHCQCSTGTSGHGAETLTWASPRRFADIDMHVNGLTSSSYLPEKSGSRGADWVCIPHLRRGGFLYVSHKGIPCLRGVRLCSFPQLRTSSQLRQLPPSLRKSSTTPLTTPSGGQWASGLLRGSGRMREYLAGGGGGGGGGTGG